MCGLVLSWVMRKGSGTKLITGPRRWTLHLVVLIADMDDGREKMQNYTLEGLFCLLSMHQGPKKPSVFSLLRNI